MKQLLDRLGGEQPAVEVTARHAADDAMVRGVDVVRADLERLDPKTPRRQGAHDGGGDRGFPHAAGGAGDDDGFHACPPATASAEGSRSAGATGAQFDGAPSSAGYG